MTTVLDVPALQGPPDIGAALQMLSEGLADRRKNREEETKRLLAQNIGGSLAGGDFQGAADMAFQSGDMKAGLDITAMGKEDKQKVLSTVGRMAAMADSPDKYNRMLPILERMLPGFSQGYGSFEQRGALIAETLSLEDQFKLEDRDTKAQEKAGEAPDVVEIFDPVTGRKQKATWDGVKFVPLGGTEAPSKGGGVTLRQTLPDGTISETIMGGEDGTALTGPTANEVQKRAINTSELAGRLLSISAGFKPEDQMLGPRLLNKWRSGVAKIDPSQLGPGEREELAGFASRKSAALGNLNKILNELSGAAVSDKEFLRISQDMPNPGTGIFDGDDPITFQSKLNQKLEAANQALARYQYYQTVGIPASLDDFEKIPLSNVKKVGEKWYVKDGDPWFEVGAINAVQP